LLDPNLLLIAASAGIMLVYREFCAPGQVWPGTCGGALLLAGSWLLVQQRPTLPGLILVALAAVSFLAILRFPRAIHFGLAGTMCLIAGLLFLLPGNRAISPWLAAPLGAVLGAITSVLARVAAAGRRNKKAFIYTRG
jgi:membrane-bound ClpP family serine protease